MSEELQQKLRNQLWTVANTLRGNMSAGDFMYYTLGFIFYKYLSEKIEHFADTALVDDEYHLRNSVIYLLCFVCHRLTLHKK